MADLHLTGRPESLSLGLQKPVTATAAVLSLSATPGRLKPVLGRAPTSDPFSERWDWR